MSKPGHNSKVQAGPIQADRLKSFVERIEKLEEERKAIGGDIKDVYSEAKGVGYDVKTVRWVVQERRMNAADRAERDALRDVYQHALDTAVGLVRGGLSLREAGRLTGASKSSIHRALAVPAMSHDADGVVTETEPRNAHDMQAKDDPAPQGSSPGVPEADEVTSLAGPSEPEGGEGSGPHSDEAPATPSVGAVASESERVAPPFLGDDPGTPPEFLRRARA